MFQLWIPQTRLRCNTADFLLTSMAINSYTYIFEPWWESNTNFTPFPHRPIRFCSASNYLQIVPYWMILNCRHPALTRTMTSIAQRSWIKTQLKPLFYAHRMGARGYTSQCLSLADRIGAQGFTYQSFFSAHRMGARGFTSQCLFSAHRMGARGSTSRWLFSAHRIGRSTLGFASWGFTSQCLSFAHRIGARGFTSQSFFSAHRMGARGFTSQYLFSAHRIGARGFTSQCLSSAHRMGSRRFTSGGILPANLGWVRNVALRCTIFRI